MKADDVPHECTANTSHSRQKRHAQHRSSCAYQPQYQALASADTRPARVRVRARARARAFVRAGAVSNAASAVRSRGQMTRGRWQGAAAATEAARYHSVSYLATAGYSAHA